MFFSQKVATMQIRYTVNGTRKKSIKVECKQSPPHRINSYSGWNSEFSQTVKRLMITISLVLYARVESTCAILQSHVYSIHCLWHIYIVLILRNIESYDVKCTYVIRALRLFWLNQQFSWHVDTCQNVSLRNEILTMELHNCKFSIRKFLFVDYTNFKQFSKF